MTPLDTSTAEKNLYAADLSKVYKRLIHTEHWHPDDARLGVTLYRRFVHLRIHHPDHVFPPSKDIDVVWHAHVLHTIEYADFCQAVFGRFLHHVPANPDDTEEKATLSNAFIDNTCELYQQRFGEALVAIFPIPMGIRMARLLARGLQRLQRITPAKLKPLIERLLNKLNTVSSGLPSIAQV